MTLHLISFNVPDPADYGGVIDVLEKVKALHDIGVGVHLHCFAYGRKPSAELESFCQSIHYYKRNSGIKWALSRQPYIVSTRINRELVRNLERDQYPIFAEGLHCTGHFMDPRWQGRIIGIRLHNIESTYYQNLSGLSRSFIQKIYFRIEAVKLKRYERELSSKPYIFFPIQSEDGQNFSSNHPGSRVVYLPAFIPWGPCRNLLGTGSYNLFHGDLSVSDNERAVEWILRQVWEEGQAPLVIAGRRPSSRLSKLIRSRGNVSLVANPGQGQMEDLIRDAHIHIIHSFNLTGIKIKLLHCLFTGRHCLVLDKLLFEPSLKAVCRTAGDGEEFKNWMKQLRNVPFKDSDLLARQNLLDSEFNNLENARRLKSHLQDPTTS